jgi:pSer/pThr/pTyr-binding forkhead associated (FHA) protein
MGILREIGNGKEHVLEANHILGRSARCAVPLAYVWIDPVHAELRWTGEAWTIRDLASMNGTFVDGEALKGGQVHVLREGSAIRLGRGSEFELVDSSGP